MTETEKLTQIAQMLRDALKLADSGDNYVLAAQISEALECALVLIGN